MRVETHNRLGTPRTINATRVVVYDDHGNPLALAVQLDNGMYHVCHLKDPEFRTLLDMLGVASTVRVKDVALPARR